MYSKWLGTGITSTGMLESVADHCTLEQKRKLWRSMWSEVQSRQEHEKKI